MTFRNLETRLNAVEQRQGGARCDNCRGWPLARVIREPRPGDGDKDYGPQPPERCPVCGWMPLTIYLVYEQRQIAQPFKGDSHDDLG